MLAFFGSFKGWIGLSNVSLTINSFNISSFIRKTLQELRMLSSVTINCQVTKIVINPGSQLSVL